MINKEATIKIAVILQLMITSGVFIIVVTEIGMMIPITQLIMKHLPALYYHINLDLKTGMVENVLI